MSSGENTAHQKSKLLGKSQKAKKSYLRAIITQLIPLVGSAGGLIQKLIIGQVSTAHPTVLLNFQ
ncbi:MAG: hypothetical protein F6K26_23300 [Moorea sp. SIO2I5]|nr:hypothetical protein [Moorena sp. SIO2I5]